MEIHIFFYCEMSGPKYYETIQWYKEDASDSEYRITSDVCTRLVRQCNSIVASGDKNAENSVIPV